MSGVLKSKISLRRWFFYLAVYRVFTMTPSIRLTSDIQGSSRTTKDQDDRLIRVIDTGKPSRKERRQVLYLIASAVNWKSMLGLNINVYFFKKYKCFSCYKAFKTSVMNQSKTKLCVGYGRRVQWMFNVIRVSMSLLNPDFESTNTIFSLHVNLFL